MMFFSGWCTNNLTDIGVLIFKLIKSPIKYDSISDGDDIEKKKRANFKRCQKNEIWALFWMLGIWNPTS